MVRNISAAPSQRQLRVGEELRHALAGVLGRGDFRDPDLANVAVTVSEVRTSPDLRNATAFVIPLGATLDDSRVERVIAALNRAAAFIRNQVAREVQLKRMPAIAFLCDRSFEESGRIERLLQSPEVRRDIEAAHDDDAKGPGDGA